MSRLLNRRGFLIGAGVSSFLIPKAHATIHNYGTNRFVKYAVMDPRNGRFLVERDARVRTDIASLTKVMTFRTVAEAMADEQTNFRRNSLVRIPDLIRIIPGDASAIRSFEAGDNVPAAHLLTAMGSRSCARSTVALAVHLGSSDVYDWGGTERQKLGRAINEMNIIADRIGMKRTNFEVVTGVHHPDNQSTARDVARLMADTHEEFESLAELSMGRSRFNELNRYLPSNRRPVHSSTFLRSRSDRVLWAKTGYTDDAGSCLSVYYERNGVPLVGVVIGETLGDSVRNQTMLNILTTGYERLGVYRGLRPSP